MRKAYLIVAQTPTFLTMFLTRVYLCVWAPKSPKLVAFRKGWHRNIQRRGHSWPKWTGCLHECTRDPSQTLALEARACLGEAPPCLVGVRTHLMSSPSIQKRTHRYMSRWDHTPSWCCGTSSSTQRLHKPLPSRLGHVWGKLLLAL